MRRTGLKLLVTSTCCLIISSAFTRLQSVDFAAPAGFDWANTGRVGITSTFRLTLDLAPEFILTSVVPMDTELRIGEVARRSGVSIDTLRYYERRRLLPRTRRSSGGFRLFAPEHVLRVQFIRQAQDLG